MTKTGLAGTLETDILTPPVETKVDDDIEGSFQRPTTLDISVSSREYGPTAGIKPLREAVAHLYNEMHRQNQPSKYTWENVAIVPGGRAGLIRIAAVLNNAYVGFFIPDYTGASLVFPPKLLFDG